MAPPLLRIENLSKSYDGSSLALETISFEIEPGELVTVIGSSGAGKSTLLRCINRLISPSSGTVLFEGKDVAAANRRELRRIRQRMSMVFQNYNLVWRSNVLENVLHGRLGGKSLFASMLGLYSEEEKQRAFDLLDRVGMGEFAYVRADQLSGGQKQRVGIARALAQQPVLILADEPIASLDPKSARTVMELLRSAVDDLGVSCIVSLHQVEYALEFSDRVICLAQGKICCGGKPSELDERTIASIYELGGGAAPIEREASQQDRAL